MNMISYWIREHEMFTTQDGFTRRCKYCNSFATVGDYFFMECKLRFNENAFKTYLEFKNLSQLDKNTYIRRFTADETYSMKDLLKSFKLHCDPVATKKVKREKYRSEPNM